MAEFIETENQEPAIEKLRAVNSDIIIPEAQSIISTGSVVTEGESSTLSNAVDTYNTERTMTSRFPYPANYAYLEDDKGLEEGSLFSQSLPEDVSHGIFHTEESDGPFTAGTASNLTLQATFALLAARQNLARSHLHYPLTYFYHGTKAPKKENFDLFSRVVVGDLESGSAHVAIFSFSKSHPRRVLVTAWTPSKEEGPLKDASKTRAIKLSITGKWSRLWPGGKAPPISNLAELLVPDSQFIRGTGSEDVHSVLWPLVKLLTSSSDAPFYSNLHTSSALKTRAEGLTYEGLEGFPAEGSSLWHRWSMGVLAHGSIPYWKHRQNKEPIPYKLLHMRMADLNKLKDLISVKPARV